MQSHGSSGTQDGPLSVKSGVTKPISSGFVVFTAATVFIFGHL